MYSKDTLTIVTIPNYKLFSTRAALVKMYSEVFQDNVIFVIENMTNVLSAYLKEILDGTGKNFLAGLNMINNQDVGVYKCNENRCLSEVYSDICFKLKYDYYLCVDPGVLIFDSQISRILGIPFQNALGARLLATKDASFTFEGTGKLRFHLDIVYGDLWGKISEDFSPFSSKKYSKEDYGVLLCRGDFLTNVGYFQAGYNRNFVHTSLVHAAHGGYDVEYSDDLYTYTIDKRTI